MAHIHPKTNYSYPYKERYSLYPYFLLAVGCYNHQPFLSRETSFYHEFHWVTNGSGVYNLNNEIVTLSKGDCIFIRKFFKCSYEAKSPDSPFSTSWVAFVGGDELLEKHNLYDYKIFKTPRIADSLWKDMIELCKNGACEAERSSACYDFIVRMLDCLSQRNKNISEQVKDYIIQHYNRNITLDEVANFIGMTPTSLSRHLRKKKQDNFLKQLKDIRIETAKDLLKTTDLPAISVAGMCGFESPSYFGKIFKEETGMTPLEYRTKLSK